MIKNGKRILTVNLQKIWLRRKVRLQPGVDGPYRNRSIEENLALFEGMKMEILKKEAMFCVLKLI
jgi:glutaminyl-tRNA synthetase